MTTLGIYRYPRRPERPRPDLDSPAWLERLESVADQIRAIVDGGREELHVGAIWGPRGTGKTSFLETLYRRLSDDRGLEAKLILAKKDSESKVESKRPPLFAPDLIDDSNGDHLFAHLLHFLKECFDFSGQLDGPLRLLTEHQFHEDFKGFESETATSKEALKTELVERLTTRATFSSKLREAIRESIQAVSSRTDSDAKRWFLLLIDDIDLVPHRGPELLTLVHLYLRDLPFIVVLAADREQFVEHTEVHLASRHGRHDRALALQYVAKQVPYEWTVPLPGPQERLEDLLDRSDKDSHKGMLFGHKLEGDFRSETAELLSNTWARLPRGPGSNTSWKTAFAEHMLAPRWRAINRTYNRLAALREYPGTIAAWQERIGVPATLVHSVLSAVVAIDEKHPQLALWDAFESDTEEVISNLLSLLPDDDVLPRSAPASDVSNVGAPRDRLCPPWYVGRELIAARRTLTVLAEFLKAARRTSNHAFRVILALTASRLTDARKELLDSDSLTPTDASNLRELDLSKYSARGRPTADEIASMLPVLNESPELVDPECDTIYPRAPLSLALWLGWHTRQRARPLAVIGLFAGKMSTFRVDSEMIDRRRREALELERPIDLTGEAPPEGAARRADEALVIIDVRPEPDSSSRAPNLWRGEASVFPGQLYKLVSPRGFILSEDNLAEVLADVLWLLQELRESGVKRFHLALATPIALAFFIGRELHPFIPVDLYEHDPETSSYRYVTTLK